MADIADVEQGVVDAVTTILYPNGAQEGSILGVTCRVYRGWPNSLTLNADLAAGVVNITVASTNDSGKLTTRYMDPGEADIPDPSLTAVAAGDAIVIAGAPRSGMTIGALIDDVPYAYQANDGDTPSLVASSLCSVIQMQRPATVSASTIRIPGAYKIVARVVASGLLCYEGRRQEKDIKIVFWCPSPETRDAAGAAVDLALCRQSFMPLDDGSFARVLYKNTTTYDQSQNASLYRRDLDYTFEFPTLIKTQLPAMLFGGAGINGHTGFG